MYKLSDMEAITWATDNLSRDRAAYLLGYRATQLQPLLATEGYLGHCLSRAQGAFDANEREMHAAYRSLARIIQQAAR